MWLAISMPLLCHLDFSGHRFSSLNLDRWWKCNVSRFNLDCRIDNLKWHHLIWTHVYLYNLDWRLLGGLFPKYFKPFISLFYIFRNSLTFPVSTFIVTPSSVISPKSTSRLLWARLKSTQWTFVSVQTHSSRSKKVSLPFSNLFFFF